jgi:uncharacterized protein
MIYKPFHDLNISQLGMGNMRLPPVGERGPINEEKARKVIEYAYEHGVNYFDTAYGYHGGESERFVGKVLNQYPRESWHLATKMPGHMLRFRNGRLEFSGYLTGLALDHHPVFVHRLDDLVIRRAGRLVPQPASRWARVCRTPLRVSWG